MKIFFKTQFKEVFFTNKYDLEFRYNVPLLTHENIFHVFEYFHVAGTGWDIYWTDRQFLSARQLKSLMPYQRINYFPGMSVLTNKQSLTERLNLFRQLFPEDYDFFPKTRIVRKNLSLNVTKTEMMNSFASTLASKITREAVQVYYSTRKKQTQNTDMEEPLTSTPPNQISIKSSETSQDIDYNTSRLENNVSCDTAGIRLMSLTMTNTLDNLNTATESPIMNKTTINSHHPIVKHPLRDITNRIDVMKEVPRRVDSSSHENIELLSQVLDIENSKQIETKINEADDKFSKENNETKNDSPERNEKRILTLTNNDNNEMNNRLKNLGIKSNGLFQTNLRITTNNHVNNIKHKSPLKKNSATQVLFKDNVKCMVMHLNSNIQTEETSDGFKKNNTETFHTDETEYTRKKRFKCIVKKTINKEEKALDQETDKAMDIQIKNVIDERGDNERLVTESKSHVTAESVMESDPIYILKPCDGCQGKGIKLAMNIGQIVNNMEFDSMICQQYIKNPLLWNGYKFDIRVYVLITSVKQLRVYIYNEGIVRLATEKYEQPDESNIDNMFMHLTNYSINKDSENFSQDFSKQSLERMNKFLQDEHGVDIDVLYAKIHDIIVKTVLTGYRPLLREYLDTFKNHVYREACFQLLGFDIILDSKCNPYLLEINKNASLKRPTPIDKVVKTKLTSDLFSILNLNENRLRGDILRDNLNCNTYRKRYIEHETEHRGDFTMIYPCTNVEKYAKYILD